MGSSEHGVDYEKGEKFQADIVAVELVDDAAHFDLGREVGEGEALRVRKKIDKYLIPLMCILYWVQFMDKTTLGSSANLGIRTDGHLNTNDNWLSTIFYISYLIFEYPQNLAFQRFPVAKWMSINIFVWAAALGAHAGCKSFKSLFAVRFIMGMCEGSITSGFMIITSMFYTREEQGKRVGYWFLMNGVAQSVSGFLSFGVLHIHHGPLHPWQWFMIITSIVTFVLAVAFWFFFPDSPANAYFLSPQERKVAIERIKVNQTGIGNKHFKREQFIEAMTDPKTWLFALFTCVQNMPNSIPNQRQIIVTQFGFTILQTTLLGIVDGAIEVFAILTGVILAARFQNARAYVAMVYFIPSFLGSILVNTLPTHLKVGRLCGVWLTGFGITGLVLVLGWVTATTAGHTKRVTVNAVVLSAYCVGNIISPQMWQAKYAPRNRVPWIVIAIAYFLCPFILWWIRIILANENKRRDAAETAMSNTEQVFMEETVDDGSKVHMKVDQAFLDLTDIQNKEFRYVL